MRVSKSLSQSRTIGCISTQINSIFKLQACISLWKSGCATLQKYFSSWKSGSARLQRSFSTRISGSARLQRCFSSWIGALQGCRGAFPGGLVTLQPKNNTFPHRKRCFAINVSTILWQNDILDFALICVHQFHLSYQCAKQTSGISMLSKWCMLSISYQPFVIRNS